MYFLSCVEKKTIIIIIIMNLFELHTELSWDREWS